MKSLYAWHEVDVDMLPELTVGAVRLQRAVMTCMQRVRTATIRRRPVELWVHGRGEFIELARGWEDRDVAFTSKVVQR